MSRKHGHWGFTEEAKVWATRARRRDEREELGHALADAQDRRAARDELDAGELLLVAWWGPLAPVLSVSLDGSW